MFVIVNSVLTDSFNKEKTVQLCSWCFFQIFCILLHNFDQKNCRTLVSSDQDQLRFLSADCGCQNLISLPSSSFCCLEIFFCGGRPQNIGQRFDKYSDNPQSKRTCGRCGGCGGAAARVSEARGNNFRLVL